MYGIYHVYTGSRYIHGIYMVYTWYIPCIIFIGVPDDRDSHGETLIMIQTSGIVTSGTRTGFLVCTWFVLVHTSMYRYVLLYTKLHSTYQYVLSSYVDIQIDQHVLYMVKGAL